jgi:hypothetical protein
MPDMVRMIALRPHTYASRSLAEGDPYEVFPEHVQVLEAVKASVRDVAQPVVEQTVVATTSPEPLRQPSLPHTPKANRQSFPNANKGIRRDHDS